MGEEQELTNGKPNHAKWRRRSEHAPMDLLHAFESGDLYDCTFRVGCDLQDSESSYRDFHCHKVILSGCSVVFETMFLSHFKEASMCKDEHIKIDRTNPDVFESAMRFVYGAVKDFKSVSFGIKVYKFAHEMQITTLMTVGLTEFFHKTIKATEIFAIFDLYTMSDNQLGLYHCKKVLEVDTSVALKSDEWLNISSESMKEFLQVECVNVIEVDLVRALIKWGEFQELDEGENLRSKILPGLQLIRFESLTKEEFAELCLEELGEVLSGDEKCSIFMSFVTGNWKLMSTEVAPSTLAPRHGPFKFCNVPFKRNEVNNYCDVVNNALQFEVSKEVELAGLNVLSCCHLKETVGFNLYSGINTYIAEGNSKQMFTNRGEEFCKITPMCTLVAEKIYTLKFRFLGVCCDPIEYTLMKSKLTRKISEESTLNIKSTLLSVEVVGLVFKK